MAEFVGITSFSHPSAAELKQLALLFDCIGVPGLIKTVDSPFLLSPVLAKEYRWLLEEGVLFEAAVIINEDEVARLRQVQDRYEEAPNYFTRLVAEAVRTQLAIDAVALESVVPLGYRRYYAEPYRSTNAYLARAQCAVHPTWC